MSSSLYSTPPAKLRSSGSSFSTIRFLVETALSSVNVGEQNQCLLELINLSHDDENDEERSEIVRAGGIILSIRLLMSHEPLVRQNAAGLLGNLAVSDDIKIMIANQGGVQELVKILNDSHLEVRQDVAGTLFNLVFDRLNQDVFLTQCDGPYQLFEALRRQSREMEDLESWKILSHIEQMKIQEAELDTKRNIVGVIWNITGTELGQKIITEQYPQGLVYLVAFLDIPDTALRCNVSGALWNLSSFEGNPKRILDLGGTTKLVSLLNHHQDELRLHVSGALRNLTTEESNNEFVGNPTNAAIPTLLHHMCKDRDVGVRINTSSVVINLTAFTGHISTLLEAKTVPVLLEALQDKESKVVINAMVALSNLSVGSTPILEEIASYQGVAILLHRIRDLSWAYSTSNQLHHNYHKPQYTAARSSDEIETVNDIRTQMSAMLLQMAMLKSARIDRDLANTRDGISIFIRMLNDEIPSLQSNAKNILVMLPEEPVNYELLHNNSTLQFTVYLSRHGNHEQQEFAKFLLSRLLKVLMQSEGPLSDKQSSSVMVELLKSSDEMVKSVLGTMQQKLGFDAKSMFSSLEDQSMDVLVDLLTPTQSEAGQSSTPNSKKQAVDPVIGQRTLSIIKELVNADDEKFRKRLASSNKLPKLIELLESLEYQGLEDASLNDVLRIVEAATSPPIELSNAESFSKAIPSLFRLLSKTFPTSLGTFIRQDVSTIISMDQSTVKLDNSFDMSSRSGSYCDDLRLDGDLDGTTTRCCTVDSCDLDSSVNSINGLSVNNDDSNSAMIEDTNFGRQTLILKILNNLSVYESLCYTMAHVCVREESFENGLKSSKKSRYSFSQQQNLRENDSKINSDCGYGLKQLVKALILCTRRIDDIDSEKSMMSKELRLHYVLTIVQNITKSTSHCKYLSKLIQYSNTLINSTVSNEERVVRKDQFVIVLSLLIPHLIIVLSLAVTNFKKESSFDNQSVRSALAILTHLSAVESNLPAILYVDDSKLFNVLSELLSIKENDQAIIIDVLDMVIHLSGQGDLCREKIVQSKIFMEMCSKLLISYNSSSNFIIPEKVIKLFIAISSQNPSNQLQIGQSENCIHFLLRFFFDLMTVALRLSESSISKDIRCDILDLLLQLCEVDDNCATIVHDDEIKKLIQCFHLVVQEKVSQQSFNAVHCDDQIFIRMLRLIEALSWGQVEYCNQFGAEHGINDLLDLFQYKLLPTDVMSCVLSCLVNLSKVVNNRPLIFCCREVLITLVSLHSNKNYTIQLHAKRIFDILLESLLNSEIPNCFFFLVEILTTSFSNEIKFKVVKGISQSLRNGDVRLTTTELKTLLGGVVAFLPNFNQLSVSNDIDDESPISACRMEVIFILSFILQVSNDDRLRIGLEQRQNIIKFVYPFAEKVANPKVLLTCPLDIMVYFSGHHSTYSFLMKLGCAETFLRITFHPDTSVEQKVQAFNGYWNLWKNSPTNAVDSDVCRKLVDNLTEILNMGNKEVNDAIIACVNNWLVNDSTGSMFEQRAVIAAVTNVVDKQNVFLPLIASVIFIVPLREETISNGVVEKLLNMLSNEPMDSSSRKHICVLVKELITTESLVVTSTLLTRPQSISELVSLTLHHQNNDIADRGVCEVIIATAVDQFISAEELSDGPNQLLTAMFSKVGGALAANDTEGLQLLLEWIGKLHANDPIPVTVMAALCNCLDYDDESVQTKTLDILHGLSKHEDNLKTLGECDVMRNLFSLSKENKTAGELLHRLLGSQAASHVSGKCDGRMCGYVEQRASQVNGPVEVADHGECLMADILDDQFTEKELLSLLQQELGSKLQDRIDHALNQLKSILSSGEHRDWDVESIKSLLDAVLEALVEASKCGQESTVQNSTDVVLHIIDSEKNLKKKAIKKAGKELAAAVSRRVNECTNESETAMVVIQKMLHADICRVGMLDEKIVDRLVNVTPGLGVCACSLLSELLNGEKDAVIGALLERPLNLSIIISSSLPYQNENPTVRAHCRALVDKVLSELPSIHNLRDVSNQLLTAILNELDGALRAKDSEGVELLLDWLSKLNVNEPMPVTVMTALCECLEFDDHSVQTKALDSLHGLSKHEDNLKLLGKCGVLSGLFSLSKENKTAGELLHRLLGSQAASHVSGECDGRMCGYVEQRASQVNGPVDIADRGESVTVDIIEFMSEDEALLSLLRQELGSKEQERVDCVIDKLDQIMSNRSDTIDNRQSQGKIADDLIADALSTLFTFVEMECPDDDGLDLCWALRVILYLSRDPPCLKFFIQHEVPFTIASLLESCSQLNLLAQQLLTNIVCEWSCNSEELLSAMNNTVMLSSLESILFESQNREVIHHIAGTLCQLSSFNSFCLVIPVTSLPIYACKAFSAFCNAQHEDTDGLAYTATQALLTTIHNVLTSSTTHRLVVIETDEAMQAIAMLATVAEGFLVMPTSDIEHELVVFCQEIASAICNMLLTTANGYAAGDEYDLSQVDAFSDLYA